MRTKIELRLPRHCVRRWHVNLAAALRRTGAGISVGFGDTRPSSLPSSIELLLTVERMLSGRTRSSLSDKVEPDAIEVQTFDGGSDLILDLSSDPQNVVAAASLRPLYDGVADEAAAFSALLAGRCPIIEIEQHPDKKIVARGRPSLDGARTIGESYEIVAETVCGFLLDVISGTAAPVQADPSHANPPQAGARVSEYLLKRLKNQAITRLYRICCVSPHWRVGWRFVEDTDVWDRMDLGGVPWKSIVNPGHRFLADPFPIEWQGKYYVFAEDFDHRVGKGIISVVPFDRNGPSGGAVPVLEEPWHLSYPFLFMDGGQIWMIPESSEANEVSLYRATDFPTGWKKEATLLSDISAHDTTIFRHEGRLWMFTTLTNGGRSTDSLSIFMADKLFGPWLPHPTSPVLLDSAAARSAGNIVVRGGSLWRPVQDCRERYGGALGLAEITRLDENEYRQAVRTVLRPSSAWPGRRIHTLNRSGRLECIDGSANLLRTFW